MIRILNLIAIVALIGSAIYAYTIKYRTMFHAETVASLKADIKKEQDKIGLLRADWAHLTRPERVQALTEKLLDLQPLSLKQIVTADALPGRTQHIDSIGRELEALGLSQPTNTPGDDAPAPATPAPATATTSSGKGKR